MKSREFFDVAKKMMMLGCRSVSKNFKGGNEEISFHMDYAKSVSEVESNLTKVMDNLRPYGFSVVEKNDIGGVVKVCIR